MRTEIVLIEQSATNKAAFWLQNCRFTCFHAFVSCRKDLELNNHLLKSSKSSTLNSSDQTHRMTTAWQTPSARSFCCSPGPKARLLWSTELASPFLHQLPGKKPKTNLSRPEEKQNKNPIKTNISPLPKALTFPQDTVARYLHRWSIPKHLSELKKNQNQTQKKIKSNLLLDWGEKNL